MKRKSDDKIDEFIEENLTKMDIFLSYELKYKMINYNKLINNLEILKLDKMAIFLPNYLESIKAQDISIVDILYRLTEEEIKYRDERASKIQVAVAGFPFEK